LLGGAALAALTAALLAFLAGWQAATPARSAAPRKPVSEGVRSVALPVVTRPAGAVPDRTSAASQRGVQKRLISLGYLPPGAATGRWDDRTFHAVMAFQAWHGLVRDGIVGPQTLAALERASPPRPAGKGRRVEVYRERGVTLLVERSGLVRALHSSSGAPGFVTPRGNYAVFRKEERSWSVPYRVWLPYASYFNGGIAFHAWADVPAGPASHGCVRLPPQEAPFAYRFMAIGTPVSVF
jgi:lipoprotein-anchoring transpeptidase ErfK/SrfK